MLNTTYNRPLCGCELYKLSRDDFRLLHRFDARALFKFSSSNMHNAYHTEGMRLVSTVRLPVDVSSPTDEDPERLLSTRHVGNYYAL